MIEKLISRFFAELLPFALNSLGVGLLLLAAYWLVSAARQWLALRREPRRWAAPLLLFAVTAAAAGGFLFLTASTPARRAFINLPMYELARSLANVTLGALLAAGLVWAVQRIAQRRGRGAPTRTAAWQAASILACFGLGSAGLYAVTFAPDLDEVTTAAPPPETIFVTDDIPLRVFEAEQVQKPTALHVDPDGNLYVAGIDGQIWVMTDRDQNGAADQVRVFASGLPQPEGLAWSPDGLYVTMLERVVRLTDTDGDGAADQTTTIVSGLPGEEYAFHQPNGLTFGPDGRLYIGVGATTDHRPETHPLAARILSVNADGSDLRVYATGLRNPYNLIPAPGGGFFAVDNGSSGCIDTPQQIDDCSHKVDVPEELNYILEGKDYGFPNYFGPPPQDSGSLPPLVTFPEHSAPTGLVLYTGDRLPAKYHGQLFLALWARGEIYSVRVYRIDAEHYVGSSRLFLSGLPGPSAIVNAPDGGLYVASFSTSTLYHVGGLGPAAAAP